MDEWRRSHYWPFHKEKPAFEELWSCHSVFGFSSLVPETVTRRKRSSNGCLGDSVDFILTYPLSWDLHGFFFGLMMPLTFRAHSLLPLPTAPPLLKNWVLPPRPIINYLSGSLPCILHSLKLIRKEKWKGWVDDWSCDSTVRWVQPHDKN